MNAITVGVKAGITAFNDPEAKARQLTTDERMVSYALAGWYYSGEMFSPEIGDWTTYKTNYRLYKHTRLIYNPLQVLVNFYVDNIWQKAQRPDDPESQSLYTDVEDGTDEVIVRAIAQADQWANWQSESALVKEYAATCGGVLLEGIDDLEREKVTQETVWAGYITDLKLNAAGDVVGYTKEYQVHDPEKQETYRYKKIVDKEKYQYFKDDKLFAYEGRKAVEDNPYGFVFAVWVRHLPGNAPFGRGVMRTFTKLNDLNSLASHINDYIHKKIESPKIIFSDASVLPLIGATSDKDGNIIDHDDPALSWVLFHSKGSGSVEDLAGTLDLAQASPELERQLRDFSDAYPELSAYSIIKQNSQLSGAALDRLLTPAQNKLSKAAVNYDRQWIKFCQMKLAVAGWRVNTGAWRSRTRQQAKFAPFDLGSYERGDLDFQMKPSQLVQMDEKENTELEGLKLDNATKAEGLKSLKSRLMMIGLTEEEAIEEMNVLRTENALQEEDFEDREMPVKE